MREQLKALYALQQIDTGLEAVRKELAALDNGAALRQQITAAEAQAKRMRDELAKVEADLQDAELKLKSVEQKKAAFEKRLYEGKASPKELSGMEKEIEMLGRSREQLDEQILALYDRVDQQRNKVKDLEARISAAGQRLEQITRKFEAETERLQQEKRRLEAERPKVAAGIDAALVRRYDTIRAHAGGIGIARVMDGRCGGCHVGLTEYLRRKIHEDGEPLTCENCGRFLISADE
jgi:predicted  nucleic acid-binding Zn-ribbon protein